MQELTVDWRRWVSTFLLDWQWWWYEKNENHQKLKYMLFKFDNILFLSDIILKDKLTFEGYS